MGDHSNPLTSRSLEPMGLLVEIIFILGQLPVVSFSFAWDMKTFLKLCFYVLWSERISVKHYLAGKHRTVGCSPCFIMLFNCSSYQQQDTSSLVHVPYTSVQSEYKLYLPVLR
jgi:hypothetical protein